MRDNPYESRRYLHEYLLFHYGRSREQCPFGFVPAEWTRFHERLRRDYVVPVAGRRASQALDLGCAVGRLAFELGRVANEVTGLDNSESFIRAARQMAKRHSLSVRVKESGREVSAGTVALPKALWQSRVNFQVGDAQDLTAFPDRAFQIVAAINLMDRLPRPRDFLLQLPRMVAPGGQLLLASPFTWLEQYTSPAEWLTGQQVESLLGRAFRLARHGDLPFVIREHRRKYQLAVTEVFAFVRKG